MMVDKQIFGIFADVLMFYHNETTTTTYCIFVILCHFVCTDGSFHSV